MNHAWIARWTIAGSILALGGNCSAGAQEADASSLKASSVRNAATIAAGCKTKDIVCQYIAATRQLLADYQKSIRAQISTTQKAYGRVAQAAEQGRRDEIHLGLSDQRNRRSETMADALIHKARPAWQWKDNLHEYAVQDFEANREVLELESTSGARYLQGMKSLEAEFGKALALDRALAAFNEKQSLADQLQGFGDFGQQTKTAFEKLVCGGLKESIAAKEAASKAADAAMAALSAQAATPQREVDLQKKRDEKKAATDAIVALNKQRTSRNCKD